MLEERLTCHVLEKHVNEIHGKKSHSTRAVGGCGLEFITSFNILFSLILNICIYLFIFLHEILQTSTPHKLSPVPFGPHPFDLQGFRQRTGHVLLSCPRKVTTNLNSLLTTAIVNVPSFIYSAPYCQAY